MHAIGEAVERGTVVLNVTQCHGGSVSMDMYETGKRLQECGVVSGRDITTESAVTKLMYLLGQTWDGERVRDMLGRSIRGEITV